MRKQRKREPATVIQIRLWSFAEAVKALPYLRAVVGSLRERWLELQILRRQVERLDARPGRPNRQALITREETGQEADLRQREVEDALHELHALDVYCLDPAKGVALIPFRQGDELAWFVFDLFAPAGLEAWRLHDDPMESRRPLGTMMI
jgi:hypothetical protein